MEQRWNKDGAKMRYMIMWLTLGSTWGTAGSKDGAKMEQRCNKDGAKMEQRYGAKMEQR